MCKTLLRIKSRKLGAQDGSLVSRFQGRCCLRIQTTLKTMMMSEDRHTEDPINLVAKRILREIWFERL